jgi:hypothetical protein
MCRKLGRLIFCWLFFLKIVTLASWSPSAFTGKTATRRRWTHTREDTMKGRAISSGLVNYFIVRPTFLIILIKNINSIRKLKRL